MRIFIMALDKLHPIPKPSLMEEKLHQLQVLIHLELKRGEASLLLLYSLEIQISYLRLHHSRDSCLISLNKIA